jgi:hypothetical protein
MTPDRGPHTTALPHDGGTGSARRDRGVRGVRHLTNWTLAALVVGVGATSAVLARSTQPTSTVGTAITGTATASGRTGAGAHVTSPSLQSPVAVTTPSGIVIQSATTRGTAAGRAPVAAGSRPALYGGDT